MGLTKAQLLERSKKKLFEYLTSHGKEVKHSNKVKFMWDKHPICARDICVLHILITVDDKILFTDYNEKEDTYKESFCRNGDELEKEYLDSIYEEIYEYDLKHS